jgi:probable rRNA maturation factor
MPTRVIRSRGLNRTAVVMPVEVQLVSAAGDVPRAREIQRWAEAALEEVADDGEPPDLCVRVVDNKESQALNARYRGSDKPTNVLSFPADVELPGETLLGDVVICAPVANAEAIEQGKTAGDHYAHLVVHGVLHLCGYDHELPQEADVMEALEVRILERVGVTDPYTVS